MRAPTIFAILLASCTPQTPEPPAGTSIRMQLSRIENSQDIEVTVLATDANDAPLPGISISLEARHAKEDKLLSDQGDGSYRGVVSPRRDDIELNIIARAGSLSVQKTALVFSILDEKWDQPEAVEGLVNTPGWEDSAEISPDGEWLIVSTYSPIDIICCLFGCGPYMRVGDPEAFYCDTPLGPSNAPERPEMPGAERVEEDHIIDTCPALGIDEEQPFVPLFPVSAYGFRRQADDSFAEPFPVAFGMDGFSTAPFGINFAATPVGDQAQLIFAFDDPLIDGLDNDLFVSDVTLGAPVSFGEYSAASGEPAAVTFLAQNIDPQPFQQGNPNFFNGRLWFDQEAEDEQDIKFIDITGALPGTPSEVKTAGFSEPGTEELQPYQDGDTLYFTRDLKVSSIPFSGGDPSQPGSFGEVVTEVGASSLPRSEHIFATGEPSIARINGETWLYFVYVVTTNTGFNANVGRVKQR
jgi:hypothetical protein